jgi:hypothetical protein
MSKLDEIRLGDIARGLRRYQPFIGVVVAVLLLVVFLPGSGGGPTEDVAALGEFEGGGARAGDGSADAGDGDTSDVSVAGGDTGGDTVGGSSTAGGGGGGTGSASSSGGGGGPLPTPEGVGADCDTATGRIKVPSRFAPPCTPHVTSNGGATARGVTADEITLVFYDEKANPATEAALTAAGANNSTADAQATVRDYVDYFNKHFNLYGRQVKLVIYDATAEPDDDAAAKADAIDIATRFQPFLVWGGNSVAFVTELANRQVLCVCTVSQPQELYESLSPYVGYTTLMSSTQGYIHRAEYLCKRLKGRKAIHAGTSDAIPLSTQDRKFGLLYYETPDNAYKAGVDFFERELAKCGVRLAARLAFVYPLPNVQSQARPFIQKLKSEGVTSVLFSGDPITPAIFTNEASNQAYFPEWIITGSALTDTSLFARTYDQRQWDKAFGISFLTVRYPQEQGEAYRVHVWHHGRPPTANNQYGVIYASPRTVFTGLHMAGPELNTVSFVRGLFSYPPTGEGMVTAPSTSWGDHGLWGFRDYTQYDDVTEIWWDRTAIGEDEVGNTAAGMYRYVDGGKRYLPGQHPTSDPRVFDPNGSPTMLDAVPPNERAPDYPHEDH